MDGEIRLRSGNTLLEGRVEICFNRAWGTVCDEGFGNPEASIICNELDNRFDYAHSTSKPLRGGVFGEGNGPIFIDNIGCDPNIMYFSQCSIIGLRGFHECDHSQDAGVSCEGRHIIILLLCFGELASSSDVDECLSDVLNICDDPSRANCTNTIGSFECFCKEGFSGNGTNCTG